MKRKAVSLVLALTMVASVVSRMWAANRKQTTTGAGSRGNHRSS